LRKLRISFGLDTWGVGETLCTQAERKKPEESYHPLCFLCVCLPSFPLLVLLKYFMHVRIDCFCHLLCLSSWQLAVIRISWIIECCSWCCYSFSPDLLSMAAAIWNLGALYDDELMGNTSFYIPCRKDLNLNTFILICFRFYLILSCANIVLILSSTFYSLSQILYSQHH
jgi:hypothetical protein